MAVSSFVAGAVFRSHADVWSVKDRYKLDAVVEIAKSSFHLLFLVILDV